jgi:hypothetical protein
MTTGIQGDPKSFMHHGLELRQNGTEIGGGLTIARALGCNKLGISYLLSSARDNKLFVGRELIPSLRPSLPANNEGQFDDHLKEFFVRHGLLCRKWVPGSSLEAYHLTRQAVDLDYAVRVARGVAIHLRMLHSKNCVHGSLHENNIIVSTDVLVTDGVLPSLLRDNSYREFKGQIFDSTTHVAPERLRGRPLQQPSDWYSFATVIWRMCTGFPPYYIGDSLSNKIEGKAFDSEFPKDSEYEWLRDLLSDILVPDPSSRLSESDYISEVLVRKRYSREAQTGNRKAENRVAEITEAKAERDGPDRAASVVRQKRSILWQSGAGFLLVLVPLLAGWFYWDHSKSQVEIQELARQIDEMKESGAQLSMAAREVNESANSDKRQFQSVQDSMQFVLQGRMQLLEAKDQSIANLQVRLSHIEQAYRLDTLSLRNTISQRMKELEILVREKRQLQQDLHEVRSSLNRAETDADRLRQQIAELQIPKKGPASMKDSAGRSVDKFPPRR